MIVLSPASCSHRSYKFIARYVTEFTIGNVEWQKDRVNFCHPVAPWQKMKKWNYREYRGTYKIEMKGEINLFNGIDGKVIIQIINEVFKKIIK
jgi:hypothetical protein